MPSKIASIESVAENVCVAREAGRKSVFTNGCYDILHPGHLDLLYQARALGDLLVVAINSDDSVRRLRGPLRPIFNQAERAEILAGLEMVDFVCTFDQDTPLEAILAIRPDVLVKGADWIQDGIVGCDEVEGWG